MIDIALATEDELSEAIALRLIVASPLKGSEPLMLRRNGFGYLRSRMSSWRQMAQRQLVFVLTDLDRIPCPVAMLDDWEGGAGPFPDKLLLRIAVREIESWVLADHQAMRVLIGSKGTLPPNPDLLPDPKQHLLSLARIAPRAIRQDLLNEKGAIASQGVGYNRRLVNWVQESWCPDRAAERSPSLRRARAALVRAAAY